MDMLHAVAWILASLLVGFLTGAIWVYIKLKLRHHADIQGARKQSVAQSRSTIKGQIAEQLAPILPGFPYAPSDARFLGDPIDYIIFHNYTALKDASADPDDLEIVILDIKLNQSRLSPTQQAIAKAVQQKRVRFEVIHVDDAGNLTANPR